MPPWLDLLVFDDATLSPCHGCHPINDGKFFTAALLRRSTYTSPLAAANTCSQLRPNRTKLSLSELFPSNLLQCGRHEDGSGVQPIPDISMDNAPEHDEPENVVPEDAALDSPQPSQGDEYVGDHTNARRSHTATRRRHRNGRRLGRLAFLCPDGRIWPRSAAPARIFQALGL